MYRTRPYLALFAATVLLQVFLFDNLSISVYCNPLIYVAFLVLLPMESKPVAVLLAGFVLGVVMDLAMGSAGINTIATLPVAFLRPTLIGLLYGRDDAREAGVPSPERLGKRAFAEYLVAMVLLHHALFFLLEALSWAHVLHTLVRILVSSAVSVGFIWLIMRIFTAKLPARV